MLDAFQRAQACGNLAPLPQLERSQQQGPEGDGGRGRHPHMFNNARTSTAPTNTTARPPPPRGAGHFGLSASARVYSNIFDPSPLSPPPLCDIEGRRFDDTLPLHAKPVAGAVSYDKLLALPLKSPRLE